MSDLFHHYYDTLYAGKDYGGEADAARRLLAERGARPPGRLLDVGCGTGNHDRHFAAQGWMLVGIDIDPEAIALAQAKSMATPDPQVPAPAFQACDVSELRAELFDAAVSLFHVVNYLDSLETLRRFLGGIARQLKPGAPLLFDVWNGVAVLLDPPRQEQRTLSRGQTTLEVRVTPALHPMGQYVDMSNEVIVRHPDGREERFSHLYRSHLWTPRVLTELLEQSGFEKVFISSWAAPAAAATHQTWKVLFTCQKAR